MSERHEEPDELRIERNLARWDAEQDAIGQPVYTGRTSICLSCGAPLSAGEVRMGYDECAVCAPDEDA